MLGNHPVRAGVRRDHRRHRTALSAILAVVAVVIASCTHAGNDNHETTTSRQFTHPSGADEVVIKVASGGGLVQPVVRIGDSLPHVWISGDGRYLRQIARETDNPALVALEERRIPEAALQKLLAEANDAGLLADSADFGTPRIFDAVNTRILVVANGRRHDVLLRALGYPVTDLDPATVAAREHVARFVDLLEHPERIAGISGPRTYTPTGVAVWVLGPATASTATPPATWPLGNPATAGTPTNWPAPSARCLVVTDADLHALDAAAAGITRTAPWRSGDGLWQIAMRPLLPDEHTCADFAG